MPTLQELKDKLKFNQENNQQTQPKILEDDIEVEKDYIFEFEEARYMLNLISNNDFKGRDVQIVYNIALKLQTILKTLND